MTHAIQTDPGPLTWVKSEIDAALARAGEALDEAARAGSDTTRLAFAQTHLHQARGALSIVGLDGLTQFADALGQLIGAMAREETAPTPDGLRLCGRALAAMGNYLDELAHGIPDQPLRLAALYGELVTARGQEAPSPADLFFPDLGRRPPRRTADAPAGGDLQTQLRPLRTRFERGLLEWLKAPANPAGAQAMRDAVGGIEALQTSPPARALWWASLAFFDALIAGSLAVDAGVKRMCAQLDAQMRRMMGGNAAVPDRLMRDLLYRVATTPATTEHQRAVRATWQLDALLPEDGSQISDVPLAPLLQDLHTRLASLRELWDEFCGGTAVALAHFDTGLAELQSATTRLGRPAVERLLTGMRAFSQWLRQDPLRFSETIALEYATALLLAETALDGGTTDTDFALQVKDTLSRLAAITRGETISSTDQTPGLAAARRSQEKEAVGQLSKEILGSLAQIEQTLDDYFRDQNKRAPLQQLGGPMAQIEGALILLGETDAIALVREAGATIARFAEADADATADSREFEALAHRLSALGFFVESLQGGRRSLQYFLDPEAAAREAAQLAEAATPVAPAEAATAGVEQAAGHVATEPPAPPVIAPDAAEISVPELRLEETEAPAAESLEAPAPAEDFERSVPTVAAIPEPTPETRKLIEEASEEEIDAELLGIFIEEAHEVLASIREHLELLRTAPAEHDHLVTVRRGFHTLKGSGRMVGLRELGEAAWGLEQTLNRWLQLEWQPTPALHHLIDAARHLFEEWVAQLSRGGPLGHDASALLADAERLRESPAPVVEPAADSSRGAAAAPATTEAADVATPAPAELEFPDLALSAEGEILPFETATAEETSLEPLHLEDTSLEPIRLEDEEAVVPLDIDVATDTTLDIQELTAPDEAAPETAGPPPAFEVEELLATSGLDKPFALDAEAAEQAPAADADLIDLDASFSLDELLLPVIEDVATDAAAPVDEAADAAPQPADDDIELSAEEFVLELPEQVFPATESVAETAVEAPAPEETETAPVADLAQSGTGETGPSLTPADQVRIGDVDISRPLFDLYLAEARHHIATLHRDTARLAANPTLLPQDAAIRAAHTLAGISGTARLTPLHTLARALEHAQERLSDLGQHPVEADTALFASSVDTLEAMLAEVTLQRMPLAVPELVEQLEQIGRRLDLSDTAEPAFELPGAAPLAGEAAAAEPAAEPSPPLHDDVDIQLLPIFLEEAADLTSQLHATLRNWQAAPDDADPAKALARLLHTLKGSARMTGAMTLGEHVHQLESRLEAAIKSGQAPADTLFDELAQGLDHAEQMIDLIASGGKAAPTAAEAGEAAAVAPEAAPEGDLATSATLRVRADMVDRFVNEAGEIGIARTRIEGELRTLRRSLLDLTENVIRLRNQLREVEIQAEVQMQSRIAQAETHHAAFDPLEMDRYTRLQELTRMMAESVNDVTTVQQNLLKNLDGADIALHGQARLSRELQQALMRVRMLPFDSLADRLYRVVRQGAKDLGKRANLDLRGGRIEVDRSVLEHMVAPLEHLLRNALAHGIETPEARRAAGKPEIGQITLTVSQEGNEIAIQLTDDGAGLDFARIAERARENGLLGANETPDERRLTNLIFVPGFSTAGAVSAVAGRGVGMDVVKSETAAVGGRIDVSSERGKGTVFHIYLPLTLAVTQALLVRAGGRSYAIPSSMVAQVMELKPAPLAQLLADGGTEWLGQRYDYRYLPRLLGDTGSQPVEQRYSWILLLRAGAQTLALHVDELRGNQEIVVKNAGPQLTRIVGMSGATVLGDGEIVLILNPVALASRQLGQAELPVVTATAPAAPVRQPTVMVVDDSLTVRKITGRLLEREGYRVVTAKDGVDALEKLLDTLPDVVLSDIEMPRMDGFDLVRNLRADARTKAVPVIMITSRLADKHRRYAEEVGANHYLGKPYQEEELLALLARYVETAGADA